MCYEHNLKQLNANYFKVGNLRLVAPPTVFSTQKFNTNFVLNFSAQNSHIKFYADDVWNDKWKVESAFW